MPNVSQLETKICLDSKTCRCQHCLVQWFLTDLKRAFSKCTKRPCINNCYMKLNIKIKILKVKH